MKKILASLTLFLSLNASASMILGSDLSVDKQQIVMTAVQNSCGYMFNYEQTAATQVLAEFQELGDLYYTISLSAEQAYEQMMTDKYDITVRAVETVSGQFPGVFTVTNVMCHMR